MKKQGLFSEMDVTALQKTMKDVCEMAEASKKLTTPFMKPIEAEIVTVSKDLDLSAESLLDKMWEIMDKIDEKTESFCDEFIPEIDKNNCTKCMEESNQLIQLANTIRSYINITQKRDHIEDEIFGQVDIPWLANSIDRNIKMNTQILDIMAFITDDIPDLENALDALTMTQTQNIVKG